MTCPPGLTAIAGADALTHAIEAFTAVRRGADPSLPQKHVFIGKNALSDHFALLAIRLLGRSLEKAYRRPSDAEARAEVMMGSLAAGCAFGAAGTAAAHAIQYPVGALTHTPHGLGVATMLPYVMTYNRSAAAAGNGRNRGGAWPRAARRRYRGYGGRRRSQKSVGCSRRSASPATLAELGLSRDRLDWTAEQAMGIDRLIKNNPRAFDLSAMTRLVSAAFDGDLAQSAMTFDRE